MKKDWRESELLMEVIVGAFIVLVLIGLGYFTIILSKESWFSQKTEMSVTFPNVMGLRDGDLVVVRGMPVGKVSSLVLIEGANGVAATLLLDMPLEMREDYEIKIIATSILGGRQLQIHQGSLDQPLVDLAVYEGAVPFDLMQGAAEIVGALQEGLIEGGVIENIQTVTAEIKGIVARVGNGEGFLGKVLSEDDALYTDLAAAIASIKNITTRLEEGKGSLGQLLSEDTALYRDVADTVAAAKRVAERVESGGGSLGKLLSEDDTLYQDLADAVAALKGIATSIDQGEGSVGKLIKDDGLYTKVQEVVDEARATLDDYRETAPITTFSSIFFGAF